LGAEVNYTYDGRYRLKTVTDSRGQATEYAYDSLMRMVRVTGPDGVNLIENTYDPHARAGKIVQLKLSNGSIYKLAYHFADEAESGFVDISDPHGEVTRVTLNKRPNKDEPYYTVEKLASVPAHH
jgi:YD repeat-containing protein